MTRQVIGGPRGAGAIRVKVGTGPLGRKYKEMPEIVSPSHNLPGYGASVREPTAESRARWRRRTQEKRPGYP